ncbi:hypothetical protein B4109_1587 [Geobacillus stearothermophilus]|uniref:Uncharacterized protein n=1 Tax=Geobacillus stearothermophilus TaxID=1422 RepID=A0A150N0D6_GEOSE|nr:hypothetical protein B4109_1587 [Geobacillus stearothermophilus]
MTWLEYRNEIPSNFYRFPHYTTEKNIRSFFDGFVTMMPSVTKLTSRY